LEETGGTDLPQTQLTGNPTRDAGLNDLFAKVRERMKEPLVQLASETRITGMEEVAIVGHLQSLRLGETNPDGTPKCPLVVAQAVGDRHGFTVAAGLWTPLPAAAKPGGNGNPVLASNETIPPANDRLSAEAAGHLIAERKGETNVADLAGKILESGLIANNKLSSLTIGLYGLIAGTRRENNGRLTCSLPVVKAAFAYFEIPEAQIPEEYLGKTAYHRTSRPSAASGEAETKMPEKTKLPEWPSFASRLIEWGRSTGLNSQSAIEQKAGVASATISRMKGGQGVNLEIAIKLLQVVGKDRRSLPPCLKNGKRDATMQTHRDPLKSSAGKRIEATPQLQEELGTAPGIAELLTLVGRQQAETLALLGQALEKAVAQPATVESDQAVPAPGAVAEDPRRIAELQFQLGEAERTIQTLRTDLADAVRIATQLRTGKQNPAAEAQPEGPTNLTRMATELCEQIRIRKDLLEAISDPGKRDIAYRNVEKAIGNILAVAEAISSLENKSKD